MRWIGEQEIEDLALGAALLASGGGGDPTLGKLMALKAIREYGSIKMLSPDELEDDAWVIPTAMMGAPSIMMEKIPNGDEALKSMRLLEEFHNRKADATMSIECGGLNSTLPFVVAAKAGIAVVDGDGMGRAFPELHMETFNIYGVQGTPMALHNERGDWCLLKTHDNRMLEHISRGIAVRMGGVAHIAEYAMTGADVKRTAIPHTMSLCIELGRIIRCAIEAKQDTIEAIKAGTRNSIYGEAMVLFKGKIVDIERQSTDGFVRGACELEGIDDYRGQTLHVDFQNENLIAKIDNTIIATVPDLITFLDLETSIPLTTESLRFASRLTCLGIPCPKIMRTKEALSVWGPRCFGHDYDFIPIEERYARV